MRPQRRKQIEQKAEDLLATAGVKAPPVDVELVARHLGAIVRRTSASEDLSGFLMRDEGGAKLIGVNDLQSRVRQRFTIAHELGHLLLHGDSPLHVDRVGSFLVQFRNAQSSTGERLQEVEANAFASSLLIPRSLITKEPEIDRLTDLSDESVLPALARRFDVSVQAMTFRLQNLGLIQTGE